MESSSTGQPKTNSQQEQQTDFLLQLRKEVLLVDRYASTISGGLGYTITARRIMWRSGFIFTDVVCIWDGVESGRGPHLLVVSPEHACNVRS